MEVGRAAERKQTQRFWSFKSVLETYQLLSNPQGSPYDMAGVLNNNVCGCLNGGRCIDAEQAICE